jgi:hypothetical protein
MIQHTHWKGIKITVIEDDRSPQQIQEDLRAIWRKNKIWNVAQGSVSCQWVVTERYTSDAGRRLSHWGSSLLAIPLSI